MKIVTEHKKVVEERGYKYLFTYEKDDITLDKKIKITSSRVYIRVAQNYCYRILEKGCKNWIGGL